jgi:hypothetical protein
VARVFVQNMAGCWTLVLSLVLSVPSGLVWVAFVLHGQSLFLLFLVVFITLTSS